MVRNTTDGGRDPPRLLIGLNALTLMGLPEDSRGPKGSPREVMDRVRAAGYEAIQTRDPATARDAGLLPAALGRVDQVADARHVAVRDRDAGYHCTTLHVGTGFESDDEMTALAEATVEASLAEDHPLYVETHRATITQDMRRTLDLVQRVPALRFNGDFSHWYTGAEMTYGDLPAKIERLSPVLARTRFLHGRVSDPGCAQVAIGDGANAQHLAVFRDLWSRVFRAFLADAAPGDMIGFYPELLSPAFHYARQVPDGHGGLREETDRWVEALDLVAVARACWQDALQPEPAP
jgi:hypothetical protein